MGAGRRGAKCFGPRDGWQVEGEGIYYHFDFEVSHPEHYATPGAPMAMENRNSGEIPPQFRLLAPVQGVASHSAAAGAASLSTADRWPGRAWRQGAGNN